MAMILRFLAAVSVAHAASDADATQQDHIRAAIQYHDEAVSLLVGVFENGDDSEHNSMIDLEEPQDVDQDAITSDEVTEEDDGILLTIHIDNSHLAFILPSENQRVRAIATSLNALASLHANLNDDRSAMDSYREALEILRAATEEETKVDATCEAKGSSIELDLAETLMNVGTFHLRRDELDAALNAYSTVFALYTGDNEREEEVTLSYQALAALNNLGIVHERRGELTEAYECYNKVREGRANVLGEGSVEVADAWVNIGNCLQRQLEWKEAEVVYGRAVEIYRSKIMQEDVPLRVSKALSGALRNNGTCCWKQRRIADAIDQFTQGIMVEDELIGRLSAQDNTIGAKDGIYQAKLSMAQMHGILGCLHLEQSSTVAESFELSKSAFQGAIEIYFEMGYESNHPSVVWAGSNLKSVAAIEEQSKQIPPPPPPPPTPPPKKRNPLPPSSFEKPDLMTRGLSDTTKFAPVSDTPDNENQATPDKTEEDSVFSGVDDGQSSMDELDDILSERVEAVTKSAKDMSLLDVKNASHESPFDGEMITSLVVAAIYVTLIADLSHFHSIV